MPAENRSAFASRSYGEQDAAGGLAGRGAHRSNVSLELGAVRVEATLENCTGNLDNWDLHCSPKNGPLGVMSTFDLSDKANAKATYKAGPLSPTAPVETRDFRCTLED